MYYNLIASVEESMVLAQYVREARAPYGSYQSRWSRRHKQRLYVCETQNTSCHGCSCIKAGQRFRHGE